MIDIKFGNTKLPASTLIFNMGKAEECPSMKLGYCLYSNICYARQAEQFHSNCVPQYRERQANYWLSNSAETICQDLYEVIYKKRKKPTLFRFNESGDFYSQECIKKLDQIAKYLKEKFDIVTYGYTARKDLDFSNVSFLVKSSCSNNGNNGITRVFEKKVTIPDGYIKCPGSCKKCALCSSDKGYNIAFIRHGKKLKKTLE